ncbi:YibE/F family protein [Orenia metallireducens]|uniref:YibE/F family protein n=1 Tax=Orenia metallireducens TaxID=1413210 RepID=A0A1C0ACI0_9FIRM|nr:YibE/F family protein [Orenia metallireducens]OCL28082.1 YibE/F family protein [Orenia metallireducens]
MRKVKVMVILAIILMIMGLFINIHSKDEWGNLEVKAIVLDTDNSDMIQAGISKIGFQSLQVKILEGRYKGEKISASNNLLGKLDIDNYYKEGDKIVVALLEKNNQIISAKAIDLYRQNWELLLFGFFVLLLILYAGYTGVKALFSFIASLYLIWNFLIPGLLEGKNPLLLSSVILLLLSAIIIFAVAGFNRKGLAAFVGTISGLAITIGITVFFGNRLELMGMTSPFAETLLFSGHLDLDMKDIFYAAIVIGASGAAMDIAMDIAASMEEIKLKRPDIERGELIQSGFNVGRAVIGTMTTTLLLAYSGGYLTLLMLFMTKNSTFSRMLNFKMVSAEILRTLTGSIGLVLVAPITAFFAGWTYSIDIRAIFDKEKEIEMVKNVEVSD